MLHNPYILFPLIALGTASAAILWTRWLLPRLALRKEYRRQLQLEQDDIQIVYKIQWSR